MKKLIISWLLSLAFIATTNAQYGTERTGYEGDFFSLEGALEVFKNSNSIRDFERKINSENAWVNNLDLNFDGQIDYIRVEHRHRGNLHAIILQAPINRYEMQDIAVIEMEKVGRRDVVLQIIGDEYLYGEQVIVEPVGYNGYSYGNGGPNPNFGFRTSYSNVYYWPVVRSIFHRNYYTYVSPYSWQYYPTWWSPWRQCSWSIFRPRIVHYHRHFHIVHIHRVYRVHHFYTPSRISCPSIVTRTNHVRHQHGKQPIQRAKVSPAKPVKQVPATRHAQKVTAPLKDRPTTHPAKVTKKSTFKERVTSKTRSSVDGLNSRVNKTKTSKAASPRSTKSVRSSVQRPSRASSSVSNRSSRSYANSKPSMKSKRKVTGASKSSSTRFPSSKPSSVSRKSSATTRKKTVTKSASTKSKTSRSGRG